PYLTATAGALWTERALERTMREEIRITYYDVGGTARLVFGLGAGVDIYLARWCSAELEARALYVHNDPDIGLVGSAHGGIRFTWHEDSP
ncbi:MAG: hypothetical protein WB626_11415, partial [Bacteroidota bacterium]